MGYSIRQFDDERRFCDHLTLEALARVVPPELIEQALDQTRRREKRHRKLTFAAVVLLTIAMNVFTDEPVSGVFARLAQGLRLLWSDPDCALPTDSALSMRRYQLGPRPLVALARRVLRPLATPATPGAFAYGLRLMAIDSSKELLPDTPENREAFGKSSNATGPSAFPHLQAVYLVECATHAICDAVLLRCTTNERAGAFRLLRSVQEGMLVLMDSGLSAFVLFEAVVLRGAELLCRLPAHVKPRPVRRLSDGTVLSAIGSPADAGPARELLVRVITYTVPDPKRPEVRKTCRLLTTLVDAAAQPALDLVCLYHARWEIELVFDEIDTHQRLLGRPLRSLLPVGCVQEFYALVIAHFAVRYLMHEAAVHADLDPRRLSFVGALRIIRRGVLEFQMVVPAQHAALFTRMLCDIARKRLPARRVRQNPRVIKRQQSKFTRKRPAHLEWPPPPGPFRELVLLI